MQQVHCTPAKTAWGFVWDMPVVLALVNELLCVLNHTLRTDRAGFERADRCGHDNVGPASHRRRRGPVFTSEFRVPSSTMMSSSNLSLFCSTVPRLQSKKGTRHFCLTSGRFMKLKCKNKVWSERKKLAQKHAGRRKGGITRASLPSSGRITKCISLTFIKCLWILQRLKSCGLLCGRRFWRKADAT